MEIVLILVAVILTFLAVFTIFMFVTKQLPRLIELIKERQNRRSGKSPPQVTCKTCDVGKLILKQKYRMSGIVVVIGYLLLLPSSLGMIIGIVSFFATYISGGVDNRIDTMLSAAGLFSLMFTLAFFVSGLLGWILVMRKRVLECDHCGAVVMAS